MPSSRLGAPAPSSLAEPTKSASAPSLEALATAKTAVRSLETSMDFSKFSTRDREQLKSFAHKRSRLVLRALSYPEVPSGGRNQTQKVVVKTEKAEEKKAAVAITLSPLDFALGKGPEAEAARNFIFEARRPLAEDEATAIYKEETSLEWLDETKLSTELTAMADEALHDLAEEQRNESVREQGSSPLEMGSVPPGDVIAATGIFGAGVKSVRARRRPVLASIRWPTEDQFRKSYHPPEELLPPPLSPKVKEAQPLPSGRKTISCLEDSTSPGIQSYIYWQFVNSKQQEAAAVSQKPVAIKAVGMFEASAIYRYACVQQGVPLSDIIDPRPIFGESVEVKTSTIVGTRQCYAIAEAIRACIPRQISFIDTVMTDMGAARIIEASLMSGRLELLCMTGTCLSYRFCTALHDWLKGRAGNSLTELVLRGCGLGNYLEVEPTDLPPLVAQVYLKSLKALPDGIIDPPAADVDLGDEPDADAEPPPTEEAKEEVAVERDEEDADRKRREKRAKSKKSKGEETPPPPPDEDDDVAVDEEVRVVDVPWWELEAPPRRAIPVALPVILTIARPGCTIRRLDLSTSRLSQEMGRLLGWALTNSQMEALFLDHCCIHDDALCALTGGLEQNKQLLELSLRGNKLSGAAEPVLEFIHCAGRHASLAHLDFSQNPIHPECIPMLESLMQYSCSVLCMHILGIGITGPDAKAVAVACRTWVEENRKTKVFSVTQRPGSRDDDEDEEEDTFGDNEEEVILCRARHVEALTDWQITSPELKLKPSAKNLDERVVAPLSWMPSGCWICKKCATVDFRWAVPDRGEGDESGSKGARLFLRPSFADFSRVELQRERAEGKRVVFWCQALVPPGAHSYIFESHYGRMKTLLCAKDQLSAEMATVTSKEDCAPQLLDLCKELKYAGRMNILPALKESEFTIPEHLEVDKLEAPEADPWAEDPIRQKALRECFEVDLPTLHLNEICHVDEEEEVKETILELYGYLYDTYSMYAGRSLWPLIRQVDVYSFFEEAGLLDRGPLAMEGLCSPTFGVSDVDTNVDQWPAALRKTAPSHASAKTLEPLSPVSASTAHSGTEARSRTLQKAGEEAVAAAKALPKVKDAIHPLSTQDIQQMIMQTITRRKNHIKRDATWSQRRKVEVVQLTREGAPISRAQFVEVLLRAAVSLRGREPSTSGALRKFADKIISGRIMQAPVSPFPRGLALLAGVVRDILLAWRKTLRQAYERFGSNETSFQRLAQLLKLCDRSFTAKHVASIYALSRRPIKYPNPQSSTLNYDEFSEAVARLALVWQPTVGGAITSWSNPGAVRACPPQPQVGQPVNQRAVALRLEAFLERMTERMKPAVVSRF